MGTPGQNGKVQNRPASPLPSEQSLEDLPQPDAVATSLQSAGSVPAGTQSGHCPPFTICLIDPDYRRRAAIAYWLHLQGLHVEPLESVAELQSLIEPVALILLADEEGAIDALTAQMRGSGRVAPIVAYIQHVDVRRIVQALRAGAMEYCIWPSEATNLASTILSERERYFEEANRQAVTVASQRQLRPLSPREEQVLKCISEGLTRQQIAAKLGLGVKTIDTYHAIILRKLGVSRLSDAQSPLVGGVDSAGNSTAGREADTEAADAERQTEPREPNGNAIVLPTGGGG